MIESDTTLTFDRPMPGAHRIVYGLFGCIALALAFGIGWEMATTHDSIPRDDRIVLGFLMLLVGSGVPLLGAALLGGRAEIVLDRRSRELRDIAWVGPVPAWRAVHAFKDVDAPQILDSSGFHDSAGFSVEIPVKDRVAVSVGDFPSRVAAEEATQAIRAALDPNNLPPFERSTAEQMRAKLNNIMLQGPAGPGGM